MEKQLKIEKISDGKSRKMIKIVNYKDAGITLIALVVTIIVLLILVGMTVSLALGNNGVLDRAQHASNTWANATVGEDEMMGDFSNEIDRLGLGNVNTGTSTPVDFAAIMAEAKGNRIEYEEIGIGTDGSILDMSKWVYDLSDDEISLYANTGCSGDFSPGYIGPIVNGEIVGTIPQYIMPEGEDEFYPVTSLRGTFHCNNELTKAPEIPSTVTSMVRTFAECSALTTASRIPEGVWDMSGTFEDCTSLVVVPNIPNEVISMNSTFSRCSALTTVPDIPDSVTSMYYTFSGCSSLVTAPKLSSNVDSLCCTFRYCTSLKNVQIPEGVTSLEETFYDCVGLESAPAVPESVENMKYTFCGCTSLTSAPRIPSNVSDLRLAFYNCAKLTGDIAIDANSFPSAYYYYGCFEGAATDNGCDLKITGSASSTIKNNLLNTKSSNSHISIKE